MRDDTGMHDGMHEFEAAWSELCAFAKSQGIELPQHDWLAVLANAQHARHWEICLLALCCRWMQNLRRIQEYYLSMQQLQAWHSAYPLLTQSLPSIGLLQCEFSQALDWDGSDLDAADSNINKTPAWPLQVTAGSSLRLRRGNKHADVTSLQSLSVYPLQLIGAHWLPLASVGETAGINTDPNVQSAASAVEDSHGPPTLCLHFMWRSESFFQDLQHSIASLPLYLQILSPGVLGLQLQRALQQHLARLAITTDWVPYLQQQLGAADDLSAAQIEHILARGAQAHIYKPLQWPPPGMQGSATMDGESLLREQVRLLQAQGLLHLSWGCEVASPALWHSYAMDVALDYDVQRTTLLWQKFLQQHTTLCQQYAWQPGDFIQPWSLRISFSNETVTNNLNIGKPQQGQPRVPVPAAVQDRLRAAHKRSANLTQPLAAHTLHAECQQVTESLIVSDLAQAGVVDHAYSTVCSGHSTADELLGDGRFAVPGIIAPATWQLLKKNINHKSFSLHALPVIDVQPVAVQVTPDTEACVAKLQVQSPSAEHSLQRILYITAAQAFIPDIARHVSLTSGAAASDNYYYHGYYIPDDFCKNFKGVTLNGVRLDERCGWYMQYSPALVQKTATISVKASAYHSDGLQYWWQHSLDGEVLALAVSSVPHTCGAAKNVVDGTDSTAQYLVRVNPWLAWRPLARASAVQPPLIAVTAQTKGQGMPAVLPTTFASAQDIHTAWHIWWSGSTKASLAQQPAPGLQELQLYKVKSYFVFQEGVIYLVWRIIFVYHGLHSIGLDEKYLNQSYHHLQSFTCVLAQFLSPAQLYAVQVYAADANSNYGQDFMATSDMTSALWSFVSPQLCG